MEYIIRFQLPTSNKRCTEIIDARDSESALRVFYSAEIEGVYNVTVERRKNVWEAIAKQHGLEVWQTGGGCEALRLEFSDGSYCYITGQDTARVPCMDDKEVMVGFYPRDEDADKVDDLGCFENIEGTPLEQWLQIDKLIKDYEVNQACKRMNNQASST
jgi:hypothetical protein